MTEAPGKVIFVSKPPRLIQGMLLGILGMMMIALGILGAVFQRPDAPPEIRSLILVAVPLAILSATLNIFAFLVFRRAVIHEKGRCRSNCCPSMKGSGPGTCRGFGKRCSLNLECAQRSAWSASACSRTARPPRLAMRRDVTTAAKTAAAAPTAMRATGGSSPAGAGGPASL